MKEKKIGLILMAGLLFLLVGTRVFAEDPSTDSIEERYQISQKLLNIALPVAKPDEGDKAQVEKWESCLESSVALFKETKDGKLPGESFEIYPEYLSDKDKKTFAGKFKEVDFDGNGPVEIPLPEKSKKFSGSIERAVKSPMLRYHDTVGREVSDSLINFLLSRTDKIGVAPVAEKKEKEKEIKEPKNLKAVPLTKKRTVIELLALAREINPAVEKESSYVDVLTTFFQLLGEPETVDSAAVYDILIEEIYYRLIEKSAKSYRTEHDKIAGLFKGKTGDGITVSEINFDKVSEIISQEKSDASFKAAAEQYVSIIRKSEKEKQLAVKRLETAIHRSVQNGMSGIGVDGANKISQYNSLNWRITNHYAAVEKGMSLYDEIGGLLKILEEVENVSSADPVIAEGEMTGVGNTRALDDQIAKHEKLLKEYQQRLRKARIERNSEEMEKNLNHIEYEVGLLESLRIRKVEQSIDYLDNNYRIFERQIDKYLSTGTLLPPEVTGKYQKSFDKIREKYEEVFKERNDFSQKRRYKEYLDLEKRMGKISSDVEIIYDRLAGEVEKQIEESQSAGNDASDGSPTGPTRRMIPDRPDTDNRRSNRDEDNTFPFF